MAKAQRQRARKKRESAQPGQQATPSFWTAGGQNKKRRKSKSAAQAPSGNVIPKFLTGLGAAGLILLAALQVIAPSIGGSPSPGANSIPNVNPIADVNTGPAVDANPVPDVAANPGQQVVPDSAVEPNPGSGPQTSLDSAPAPETGGKPPSSAEVPSSQNPPAPSESVPPPVKKDNVTMVMVSPVIPCQQTFCAERGWIVLATLERRVDTEVMEPVEVYDPTTNSLIVIDYDKATGELIKVTDSGNEVLPQEVVDFIRNSNAGNACNRHGYTMSDKALWASLHPPFTFGAWVAFTPAQQNSNVLVGKRPLRLTFTENDFGNASVVSLEQGFNRRNSKYLADNSVNDLSVAEMLQQGYIWIEKDVTVFGFEAPDIWNWWPNAFRIVIPSTVSVNVDYLTERYNRREGFDYPAMSLSSGKVAAHTINITVDEPGLWGEPAMLWFTLTLTGPQGDVTQYNLYVLVEVP